MQILRTVRDLNLPDWFIGAGFVRDPVWDALHGYTKQTPLKDIDIAYFDSGDLREETEKEFESILMTRMPTNWSVKNQARMAQINHQPRSYTSASDALAHWPETATAVGITMLADDSLRVIAPHGLDDLLTLKIRMTPEFGDGRDVFLNRVNKKQWLTKWPLLELLGNNPSQ